MLTLKIRCYSLIYTYIYALAILQTLANDDDDDDEEDDKRDDGDDKDDGGDDDDDNSW